MKNIGERIVASVLESKFFNHKPEPYSGISRE
jgi:hypothetical protein